MIKGQEETVLIGSTFIGVALFGPSSAPRGGRILEGIRHAYIKKGTPQLNREGERSHHSDQEQFYPFLTYKEHVDLKKKLEERQSIYNFD